MPGSTSPLRGERDMERGSHLRHPHPHLVVGGAPAISSASCTFMFTFTFTGEGSEILTLNATATVLQCDQVSVLVDGDQAPG